MKNLTTLILATIYLTYLAVYSQILNMPRSYVLAYTFGRNLLSCPLCTGFWMGGLAMLLPRKVALLLALAGANFIYWSMTHED